MIKNKAIQIIGTQRSGSNLLRVMLNQIQEIDAPHPPHILQRFYPLLSKYGDLNDELNFLRLIDDICKLIESNPVPWEGLKLDSNSVKQQCKSNTLLEIFRVIYSLKATHSKASYWCCKSMSNINYVEQFEASGIQPLYIHLYRDGRDVALSFKKAIVGPKHIYHLANKWKAEQDLCLKLKRTIHSSRFFSICYEDLIEHPEAVLNQLCLFLKIPFNNAMLTYYNSDESKKTASSGKMWKNISHPILKHNSNKFLNEMNADDLLLFESISGSTLTMLNYKLYANGIYKSISKKDIETYHVENELLKQQAVLNADKKDMSRKKVQLQLLKDIANREIHQFANV
ncbi:sulfotransferase [uncultured Formosa sp.]|uniref:sulfotransferase family protein n=1 Tax=uncultured Formosa sp. TaxID=255435 RepID=UPI00261274CD|nr:sulfotransferase [uncultured Formosa sp.]